MEAYVVEFEERHLHCGFSLPQYGKGSLTG